VGGKNVKKGDLVERKEAGKGRVKEVGQDPPLWCRSWIKTTELLSRWISSPPCTARDGACLVLVAQLGTGNTRWSSSFQCSG